MFTKSLRTNVDTVEQSFVDFKREVGEKEEEIVSRLYAERVHVDPIAPNRNLSAEEFLNLEKMSPWGYSFRITNSISAFDLDQRHFGGAIGPRVDDGLVEMDLRISVLERIFADFCQSGGRWLDVATNCGVIPILINRNRSLEVHGIDLFEGNIEKAQALLALSGLTNMSYSQADAYEYLAACADGSFDIVSALGLFYHLSDPIGLMASIFRVTKRVAIIDTVVHNFGFSGWIQTISRHTKYEHLGHANDTRKIVELHPTYRGLVDTLFQVGFNDVIEVAPSQGLLNSCPSQIYSDRNRIMLVAIK